MTARRDHIFRSWIYDLAGIAITATWPARHVSGGKGWVQEGGLIDQAVIGGRTPAL